MAAPASVASRNATFRRMPAVWAAVCFVLGIVADRTARLPWAAWIILAAVLLAAWSICLLRGRERLAAVALLLCCVGLGGARHHAVRSVGTADDIALFATEERTPVRLTGVIASAPWARAKKTGPLQSAWPQLDTTVCDFHCRALDDGGTAVPVSGRVRLRVSGHLLHAEAGDLVEVRGWMSRPRGPANAGEFDYREYLERQGIRCLVSVEHPDAVRRLATESGWWLPREVSRIRAAVAQRFVIEMSTEAAPVAAALLLGDRSQIDEDLQTAFAESGMMHVLAISGLHVGILAALCFFVCRALNLSPIATAAFILLAVTAQAVIAGGRPPIMRASVFVFIAVVGQAWFRRAPMGNTLAAAALAVLVWNPANLFDIGTQLSFLAVAGILWWQSWRSEREDSPGDDDALTQLAAGPFGRMVRWLGGWLTAFVGMMLGIWLFTAPLIAAQFHLVSPIGLVLNVALMPLVTLVLWCGYLSLFFGLISPWLAVPFTALFDWGLSGFLAAVGESARYNLGHLYVAGPSVWWLVGYYVLLAFTVFVPRHRWRIAGRWHLLCAWGVVGLTAGLIPDWPHGLRCTFLAVGHGNAVLLELPNGRTLLCDAGALDDADRAGRAVQQALWSRGRTHLDALVVSHADLDHFNAVPRLLETVPVGTLLFARSFLSFDPGNVDVLTEAAFRAGVPIRLIGAEDRLRLDENVSIEVLHPPLSWRSAHDNANSVVLQIEYAGRRVLLTGDLEHDGMDMLLALPPRKIDVLLSPHHGSLAANSSGLAEWGQPDQVIVSGGRDQVLPVLKEIYGERALIWNTSDHGAVTVTIRPDSPVDVQAVRAE